VNLIDIGANLTHSNFDADRDAVIRDAGNRGIQRIIVTGASAQGSLDAFELTRTHPGRLFSTAGVHPHHAADYTDEVHTGLDKLTRHEAVVAVGECGLDFFRDLSPREQQKIAFERQLDIAALTKLPVFLHQRNAHEDFVDILAPRMPELSRAVAHCFTGDEAQLRQYLDMGLYIGITGWICDERRGAHLKEIVSLIPDDRLMIETDAPYLLPRSLIPKPESRRNEPKYLREILRVVADSRQQTEEEVAANTTATAQSFFDLPR